MPLRQTERKNASQRFATICLLLCLSLTSCATPFGSTTAREAATSAAVVATIPTGEGPTLLALSPDGSRLYAAANSKLTIISTHDNRAVGSIETQPYPTGLAITPDGTRALLASLFSVQLMVVDTTVNALITPIDLFAGVSRGGFGRIALSPDGRTAYVANTRNTGLAVIDLATSEATSWAMDMRPVDVALAADGRRVYVAGCKNFCTTGTIEVLDAASQLVITSISVGAQPYRLALSPDGAHAYTANVGDPSVSIVDLASQSTTRVPVPVEPLGLAVSRDGARIYVASQTAGTITVIDAATTAVLQTAKIARDVREVVVSADSQRLYISTLRSVLAVDTALLSGA